ncbi:GntR family transcriptional regulator [Bordetella hinzii]|uniref:GntR family transcriptional regulator n=1 Tax=Bordetella hinzii TaxID=103855 RepID=UPI0013EFF573|nr:GntR family transcriptional regulator [Bordetella hinzii]QII85363.1 GntR family transcriptional regulator [Bordetella hinzii]
MAIDPLSAETPNPTLPGMVYQKVRDAILNGVFRPGQMLRQDEVANRLGVSRSPLREALPRLEVDGIVVLHPRRGYAVASLDPEQITEVFDLRCLLETELARRAIGRRSEADIAAVYAIASEMGALAEQRDDDSLARWFDLNTRFHKAMLNPAGCPHHLRALEHSRTLIESYIRTETRLTGDLRQAQQEHIQLAQAFVMGDSETFVRLTREHSEHTRTRLLTRLPPGDPLTDSAPPA